MNTNKKQSNIVLFQIDSKEKTMDKPTEKFISGNIVDMAIPLNEDDDHQFILLLQFLEKVNEHNPRDNRRYLKEIGMSYQNEKFIDSYQKIILFDEVLHSLTDRRMTKIGDNPFFEQKQKDNIPSLQLKLDQTFFLSMSEAMLIRRVFHEATQGYSKTMLFDKYINSKRKFMDKDSFKMVPENSKWRYVPIEQ